MLKKIILIAITHLLTVTPIFAASGTFKVNVFPVPPNLAATVKFSEPSGNNILDAQETGKLIVTVTNNGKGDAYDVKAELSTAKPMKGLSFDNQVSIGTIPPNKVMTVEIPLKAAEGIETDDASFKIEIKEANGFDAGTLKIAFKVKSFEPPKLTVADIGIDDQNGNSRVEPMEIIELTARIQNVGYGDAREVSADVQLGENVFIAGDGSTHFDLGSLQAGKHKDIKFMFYTNKRIANGEKIPITIKMNEARPQFGSARALELVMNAQEKKADEIIVKEIAGPKGDIELATGLSIDVDMKIPSGHKAEKDDIAVIIGNKSYSAQGLPDVEFADRDARIMKEYLIKTFGFRAENIIYEENATLSKFNEIFGTSERPDGRLSKYLKKGKSSVFVYYVGHGAPDLSSQDAYFVPVDANPQYIATNGYKLQTFYDNLSKIPAKKVTIVLDSCFSGNSEKGLLFKNISPAMVKVKKTYRGPQNASLITSAAVDEVSTWYRDKKHSLFTYYFLKALQGDADADRNNQITLGEIKAYLKENVSYMARRMSGNEQNPVVTGNDAEVMVTISR